MLVAHLHFLLQFALLVKELLLHLKELFLFHHVGFLLGSLYHLIVFSLKDIPENEISANTTQHKGYSGDYYIQ